MTVYVDDMYRYPMGRFRRMKMSHMIADTEAELHAMAQRIGVARRWYQGDHYDICLSKRVTAISLGAVPVTVMELGRIMLKRRGARRRRIKGMNRIILKHCIFEITPRGCRTIFADDAISDNWPHEDEAYQRLAADCGLEPFLYCREHDLLHNLVAEKCFNKPSPTIWKSAHGQLPDASNDYEEKLIYFIQRGAIMQDIRREAKRILKGLRALTGSGRLYAADIVHSNH